MDRRKRSFGFYWDAPLEAGTGWSNIIDFVEKVFHSFFAS